MTERSKQPKQTAPTETPKEAPKQEVHSPLVPLLVIVIPMLLLVLYGVLVD